MSKTPSLFAGDCELFVDGGDEPLYEIHADTLTVLCMGGGQDSAYLAFRLVEEPKFKERFIGCGRLICMFADTGCEKPETYEYLRDVIRPLLAKGGIPFYWIRPEMGYHSEGCETLWNYIDRYETIPSVAYGKRSSTCSFRVKQDVINRAIEHWLSKEYQVPYGRKRGFKKYFSLYGKVRVMLGIAHGEESRVQGKEWKEKWKRVCLEHVYPLIEEKIDRDIIHSDMAKNGWVMPMPSACEICHWTASGSNLVRVYKKRRQVWDRWVAAEKRKLDNCSNLNETRKNFGVVGRWHKDENRPFTLEDALAEVLPEYDHLSIAELDAIAMQGHAVKSCY